MMLLEKLLSNKQRHMVALVGAGGKTTVMYELAEYLTQQGLKVLVTTSTHIQPPPVVLWAQRLEQAQTLWQRKRYAVVGQAEVATGKVVGLSENELKQYTEVADIVLVEADGAKHYPCKVPKENEPVIPAPADIVLGVIGMDAWGKQLKDCCFRLEQVCALLKCIPEHVLTLQDMATILLSEQGTHKHAGSRAYFVVLNKCDNEVICHQAEQLAALLAAKGLPTSNILLRNKELGLWAFKPKEI